MDLAGASAGFDEGEAVEPFDFFLNAKLFIEVNQIGAAAQQDVLAVVHDLAGAGVFVRGGASAHVGAAFEESHLAARVGEGAPGGEAREASADDGDCFLGCVGQKVNPVETLSNETMADCGGHDDSGFADCEKNVRTTVKEHG